MFFKETKRKDNFKNYESRQSLISFFSLLLKIDKRTNPKMYESNRDTTNPN